MTTGIVTTRNDGHRPVTPPHLRSGKDRARLPFAPRSEKQLLLSPSHDREDHSSLGYSFVPDRSGELPSVSLLTKKYHSREKQPVEDPTEKKVILTDEVLKQITAESNVRHPHDTMGVGKGSIASDESIICPCQVCDQPIPIKDLHKHEVRWFFCFVKHWCIITK